MKRFAIVLILCLLFSSLAFGQGSSKGVQVLGILNEVASAQKFEQDFTRIIPYHDEAYHFTVTKIGLNTEYRFATMSIIMDPGYKLKLERNYYLGFLLTNAHWDVQDLFKPLFDLRINVSTTDSKDKTKGQGNCAVTITNDHYLEAINTYQYSDAKMYLAGYAEWAQRSLPITTGEGERCVQFRYDMSKAITTVVFDYEDSIWPDVKKYILDNYDRIREIRALNYLMDTTNNLVFCAQTAGVSIRHLYTSRSHTDSLDITIAPWMWEHYAHQVVQEPEESTSQLLFDYFEQLPVPIAIDSVTTLISASYDTVSRIMSHQYQVTELRMLRIDQNPEQFRQAIYAGFSKSDFLEVLPLLLETQSSVSFSYRSRFHKNPVEFVFTYQDLKRIAE